MPSTTIKRHGKLGYYSTFVAQKPFIVTNPKEHSMEDSIYRYLSMKVHELIEESDYDNITVVGEYDRCEGVSRFEKNDKLFNWQRPTAVLDERTLLIKCFPGRDYVRHYAAIIGTHLSLHQKDSSIVSYILPSEETCWETVIESNIRDVPSSPVAVLGYGLPELTNFSKSWKGEGAFSWLQRPIQDQTFTFIGCRHSIWSDIGARVVQYLAFKGFEKIIYIGKLGSLNPEHRPNEYLATGNSSYIEGEIIKWDSPFDHLDHSTIIKVGKHYNCPSVLFETKTWLNRNKEYDFIDPEIGQMARAALSTSVQCGYVHLICDNLSERYTEDLSNERKISVKEKRQKLLTIIKQILEEGI